MDKFAGNTSEPDYNANNPLPAAAALAAIGGIAGLGGSLLSKKQRKHKLRNTLLGATALPAAFLAANKWGPEAVKSKLNDFSGNVYDQYAKHIATHLPEAMTKYIGVKNGGNEPVYTGVSGADVVNAGKSVANATVAKQQAAADLSNATKAREKQDRTVNNLEKEQTKLKTDTNTTMSEDYARYLSAMAPTDTSDLAQQISKLEEGTQAAVVAQLEEGLKNNTLDKDTRREWLRIRSRYGKALENLGSLNTSLEQAKLGQKEHSRALETLQQQATEFAKNKQKFDDESAEAQKKLDAARKLYGDENAILAKVSPDNAKQIQRLNTLATLATSEDPAEQTKLLSMLANEEDPVLKQVYSNVENAAKSAKDYTPDKRTAYEASIREQIKQKKQNEFEKAYEAAVAIDPDAPDDLQRWQNYEDSGEYEKDVQKELSNWDSQKTGRDEALAAAKASQLRAAQRYASTQAKGLRKFKADAKSAVQKKKDELLTEIGLLEKRLATASPFTEDSADYKKNKADQKVYAQMLQEDIAKLSGIEAQIAEVNRTLADAYDNPWFRQQMQAYDAANIAPIRAEKQSIEDMDAARFENASNEYGKRYAKQEQDLTDIASRLDALKQEQNHLLDVEESARQAQLTAESDLSGTDTLYQDLYDQWISDQNQYNEDTKNWRTRVRESDEANRKRQNDALAATGGGAGALILLSALNKLRKRRKQKISPEEYINYLEEEGMA